MKGEESKPAIFALGHSTRPIDKFEAILQAHSISTLVDIRTVPKSRHNPQFDGEALHEALTKAGVCYLQMKELGGLRRPMRGSIVNAGWINESFRGFADYMQTAEFETALEHLIRLAGAGRVAIMCAEGNPYRCHRSLVADALEARGVHVLQISGPGKGRPHRVTSFAKVVGARVTYPKMEAARRRPAPHSKPPPRRSCARSVQILSRPSKRRSSQSPSARMQPSDSRAGRRGSS